MSVEDAAKTAFERTKTTARLNGDAHVEVEAFHGESDEAMQAAIREAERQETFRIANENRFVDWATFWNRDIHASDWLYPDVLARGRGHALYAGHKTGKSLLMLWLSAQIATTVPDALVVYLDYEMGEDDLYERLDDMGYGPHTDFSRLRYALLPSIAPLDRPEGAKELDLILDDELAKHPGHHLCVIIDTTARAVEGDENSADTIRAFYRWTGLGLKQRRATWARLDHAGKEGGKGQRGTSAKGDDVDVIWRVARTQDGIELRKDAARMSWVPDKTVFHRGEDPLRYIPVASAYPAGTSEMIDSLNSCGVPLAATYADALAILRKATGSGGRKLLILAALKARRECALPGREPVREPVFDPDWEPPPEPGDENDF